ncbi:dienelactone hydrolase endo-1,3,1,4-beta-D-glucanase [Pholiota conissans]|uniref:Dienelactone hydrolase endo-1,3,1,4-beta-D-glucanase n=1 Tax=Pholiota conissans TaxID=109636 RepID=A0A9P5YRV4_9AGAR|nr:dienelactone hydrolase endo-1,3,1,4-beta-D-glucanase [Pholiota conissans]
MATVCPRCAEGIILSGEPTGSISTEFQGAYFAPAPELGGSSKFTVLLLTDAFGMPVKNCKIMADELAKRLGCDVWIPDYFNGKPLLPADKMSVPARAGVKISIWEWIRFAIFILPQIPVIISNRPSVVNRRLISFMELIRDKKKYEKIGMVGYCFGGSTCVRMGSTNMVNSIIIAHPGKFTLDQVKAIKVPTSWICAEDDMFFPDALRDQSEAEFASRKNKDNFVDYEFKIYKGTAHGFASRPNLELQEIKQAYEEAFEQTVAWFKKTIFL